MNTYELEQKCVRAGLPHTLTEIAKDNNEHVASAKGKVGGIAVRWNNEGKAFIANWRRPAFDLVNPYPLIYIAGKVTGLPLEETRVKFAEIEKKLEALGFRTSNPMKMVPSPYSWEQAMKVCLDHLDHCDAIFLLKDWKESLGARLELEKMMKAKKPLFFEEAPKVYDQIKRQYSHVR